MNHNAPIVVGISGLAGAGKTSTAESIVAGSVMTQVAGAWWDHTYFAAPLYALATIRRKTLGELSIERQLYQAMSLYMEMYVNPIYGAPTFDDLIRLVKETVDMPIPLDEDIKPRAFLQQVGLKARELNSKCFVNYTRSNIRKRFNSRSDQDKPYIMLVSDLRYPDEAEMITNHENSIIIKLNASQKVREDRIHKRDGKPMTEEQLNHESESFFDAIPENYTIETDNITLAEQSEIFRDIIIKHFNLGEQ